MGVTWKEKGQNLVYTVMNPLVQFMIKIGITPNHVTLLGLIINIIATVILVYGAEKGERNDHTYVGYGGITILLAGLMDMLDGRLAREGKMSSKYGALFDSVLDRYSEMVMFLGICYYLISYNYFLSSLFAFIAMIGSIMVSYTRARAEGLGVSASGGTMQRPERILIIGITMLLCGSFSNYMGGDFKIHTDILPVPLFETISIFTFPLFVLAIWTNITAVNRLLEAKHKLKE